MHLSLSFTHTHRGRVCRRHNRGARGLDKDERPDPKAQLAASFKEARALLDEVGSEGTDSE